MCVNPQYLSDEGGIHLTSHAFLPTALLKELSATEDQFYSGIGLMYVMTKRIVTKLCPGSLNFGLLFSSSLEHLDLEQTRLYTLYYKEYFSKMRGKHEGKFEMSGLDLTGLK